MHLSNMLSVQSTEENEEMPRFESLLTPEEQKNICNMWHTVRFLSLPCLFLAISRLTFVCNRCVRLFLPAPTLRLLTSLPWKLLLR